MAHRFYSPKVRQRAIARVLDAHIAVATVAREVGCSTDTMHRWLREHRQQKSSTTVPQEQATFVPIKIVGSPTQPIEIVTPTGITIRLPDASPQYLAELLHALTPSC